MMVCITCDEHENPARLTFNGILNLIRSIEEVEIWITYRFSNDKAVQACTSMSKYVFTFKPYFCRIIFT